MVEYGIVNDLVAVGNKFPLTNGISHECNVVYRGTLRIWGLAVLVELERTANIPHESYVAEAYAFYVFLLDEGNNVKGDDIVAGLEGLSSNA